MGLVVCPKHGNGFMFVCPEVADAVRASAPCPGIAQLAHYADDEPELVLECWFCPACVTRYGLPPSGAVPDSFLDTHSALYRPMCPECFGEWQSSGAASGGFASRV